MINLSNFYQDLDNDKDCIIAVLELFISEYENIADSYLEYHNSQQWDKIYIISHSLRGVLEGFGESNLILLLQRIELQTSKNKPITNIEIQDIVEQLSQILAFIKEEINNLR